MSISLNGFAEESITLKMAGTAAKGTPISISASLTAALAGSWLTQCRAADETRQLSFRAGDVSITQPQKSEGKNSLALLLEDAMQQAAPLLKDDGFAFWQIGVT